MLAEFHLTEDAFALHLLLQRPEGLVEIVVTDKNLHAVFLFNPTVDRPNSQGLDHWRMDSLPISNNRCFDRAPQKFLRPSLYSIRSFTGNEKVEPRNKP